MPDALYLIDAIGPFFRGYQRRTINWSKIPFEHLRLDEPERSAQWTQIRADLDHFARQAVEMGFNSVSLDDVTHLADHPDYEDAVRQRIAVLREEFSRCFDVLGQHGLGIYLTMDFFSCTPGLREQVGRPEVFVRDLLDRFLADFPQVRGVILRIGESDGRDVKDDFRSELVIKKPSEANALLKLLLPVFKSTNESWSSGPGPSVRTALAT